MIYLTIYACVAAALLCSLLSESRVTWRHFGISLVLSVLWLPQMLWLIGAAIAAMLLDKDLTDER